MVRRAFDFGKTLRPGHSSNWLFTRVLTIRNHTRNAHIHQLPTSACFVIHLLRMWAKRFAITACTIFKVVQTFNIM